MNDYLSDTYKTLNILCVEDGITYIFLAKNDFNTGGSQNGYS